MNERERTGDGVVGCESEWLLQPLKKTLADVERRAIEEAITAAKGNKLEAAKLLGIGKTKLYEKCKKYGIRG